MRSATVRPAGRRAARCASLILAVGLIAATTAAGRAAVRVDPDSADETGGAPVRIGHDYGGQIGNYIHWFERLRRTGQHVIVDGDCLSACTLVLGLIPDDRLCVTRRARFGFHRAWKPGFLGIRFDNRAGTRKLWELYPAKIRRWIVAQSGLSDGFMYLSGTEMLKLYPLCRPRNRR
jgi:hypothetical protein